MKSRLYQLLGTLIPLVLLLVNLAIAKQVSGHMSGAHWHRAAPFSLRLAN